jgi:hypothetical protein
LFLLQRPLCFLCVVVVMVMELGPGNALSLQQHHQAAVVSARLQSAGNGR